MTREKVYMFNTLNIFKIFSVQGWLNNCMWNVRIWRADCVIFLSTSVVVDESLPFKNPASSFDVMS